MFNSTSSKARVRKVGWNSETPRRCWWVTNHLMGSRGFVTWEEAMRYANSRPLLMNNVTELQYN